MSFSLTYSSSRKPAFFAVFEIVSSRLNSKFSPFLVIFLNFLSAIFMFLVPSCSESSRFSKFLSSQTFAAIPLLDLPPTLMPFGCCPALPKGEVPAVPTHLLPPWCSFSCSSRRFLNSRIKFSRPPRSFILSSSSLVSSFSNCCRIHSSGMSVLRISSMFSIPLK